MVLFVVMVDVDLVKNIFGFDSEDDDDGDCVVMELFENCDDCGCEFMFKLFLEFLDDVENDEDDLVM